MFSKEAPPPGLRVIKTARTEAAINAAARAGFKPLLKRVLQSEEIRSKFAIYQNQKTGEIDVVGDYRAIPKEGYREAISWTGYYPYSFPSPFAAYLIPNDIRSEERLWVEDVIEDFVGMSWNQGGASRLNSCEAIWNGEDLIIQFNPDSDRNCVVG